MKHLGKTTYSDWCRCIQCYGKPGSKAKKIMRKIEKSSSRQQDKRDITKALKDYTDK